MLKCLNDLNYRNTNQVFTLIDVVLRYNDVNNQQDATTFSFINLFNSALHVSGDKFALPQDHFLTVYTAFDTMLKVPSQPWHRSAAVSAHCTKSCIHSQKVLPRMDEFVARNM